MFDIVLFENGVGRAVSSESLNGCYMAFKDHEELFHYVDSVRAHSQRIKSPHQKEEDEKKHERQMREIARILLNIE